jgi:microcystin-dependent protein
MAMSSPFVSEITIFAFQFAPSGWALCQGQLLPLSQNTALFSLLGTTYGGNGTSNFALPDLRDQTAVAFGQGAGLSNYQQGEQVGAATVTLLTTEMPFHNHFWNATTDRATATAANGNVTATGAAGSPQQPTVGKFYSTNTPNQAMAPNELTSSGSSNPHNNMQPYLTLNFCIAMQGVFPPRG